MIKWNNTTTKCKNREIYTIFITLSFLSRSLSISISPSWRRFLGAVCRARNRDQENRVRAYRNRSAASHQGSYAFLPWKKIYFKAVAFFPDGWWILYFPLCHVARFFLFSYFLLPICCTAIQLLLSTASEPLEPAERCLVGSRMVSSEGGHYLCIVPSRLARPHEGT